MKLKFFNIFLLLFTAVAVVSCSSEDQPSPEGDDASSHLPPEVYLNLNVGVLSQTSDPGSRANAVDDKNYFEGPDSQYEKMQTLRVIIVRGERTTDISYVPDSAGYVEHNHLFRFNELGLVQFDDMTFKVRSGEKKRIYLIANEAFVKTNRNIDFENLKVGQPYPDGFIENIVLNTATSGTPLIDNSGDTDKWYIPMSEEFDMDIPVPQDPLDYRIDKSFFITRASVKFSFTVATSVDYTRTGLQVKSITVNSVSDREYFLPRETEYLPAKDQPSTNKYGGRFIESYLWTAGAVHSDAVFSTAIPLLTAEKAYLYNPPIYYPESRNSGDFSVTVTLGYENDTDNDITFEPQVLPNLPALPRNTHVLVNMTLTTSDITAEVKLVPYIGVYLDPKFGFDELIPWDRKPNGQVYPVGSNE